ncbi:DNA photolyase phr1 [Entomophthora muscae]|uniref:DNA photolyase phr1 n=1 Tax=Entomophthora muscae TaxID=34485 RepID=A0ACC2U4C9_9FUNG|nr:DNA photolyase phr1 [Entomophthora muscae]
MWFRSDLRLSDNRALQGALKQLDLLNKEKAGTSSLFALFIVSTGEWQEHDASKFKVDFILRNVEKVAEKLKTFGVPLVIKTASNKKSVPNAVMEVCKLYHINEVYCNIEYEVNESKRDEKVKVLLMQNKVLLKSYHDQCAVPPKEILKLNSDKPFKVYTPFKKAWMDVVYQNPRHLTLSNSIPSPSFRQPTLPSRYPCAFTSSIPKSADGFALSEEMQRTALELYPAGEVKARERMDTFIAEKLGNYKEDRDFVCKPGTSVISPYLTCGVISSRQCIDMAQKVNNGKLETGDPGAVKWILEIVWREFFRYILVAFPRVSKSLPFIPEASMIKWDEKDGHFDAWKTGLTGYPLVDAGMRELVSTGWISNRIRMTAASFLTKDLLINWQKGEAHFMRHLIDGDLASNNGGWQWAASTGTDPKPYLRIFNPLLQSEKFDPNGEYIRKWVPELRSVKSNKAIHDPFNRLQRDQFNQLGYPVPLVDHHKTKAKAEKVYGAAIHLGGEVSKQAHHKHKGQHQKKRQV